MLSGKTPFCSELVGSCADSPRAKQCHEGIPQLWLELSSPVRCDGRRDAEAQDPSLYECLCHRFCGDILDRECFRPPRIPIDAGEKVRVAIGWWKWTHNVYVDAVEPGVRCLKRLERSVIVSVYLVSLALFTGSGPPSHVGIHLRPYVPWSHELLRASYAGMRERM